MGNRAISDVFVFNTAIDTRPPQISKIRSQGDVQTVEIQPDRSRAAQLIVSWETDEPATSQVLYGEGARGDNYPFSTQTDSEMRTKHVLVVNNLSPSKVYHFKVVSKDGAGNAGESGSVTAITPKG
ncbi:fibronectin type III domain-containing protein, partial [Arthrospira platensis SPKY1]|nr:fibronectin type III domain-containing protein [Arthrospira platensis SPKY1]